jgi:hypothetical protein
MIVAGTLLFAASTIPPYLVAWPNPTTIADLAFFSVFGAGLALNALYLDIRTVLRQPVLDIQATWQKIRGETK